MAKRKKEDRKFVLAFSILILTAIALLINFIEPSGKNITGAVSAEVVHRGVSNYPIADQGGKMQTEVELEQPTLGSLGDISTANAVNQKILDNSDLVNGIIGLYKINPPAPLTADSLNLVTTAAETAVVNFKKDTSCLKKIYENYGNEEKFNFVIVTDLVYSQCKSTPEWLAASVEYTFYNFNGNNKLCTLKTAQLFSTEIATGKISVSATNC